MDAVVVWLDTTDKDYIEQRNKDFKDHVAYDIHRVGKRDELRFCLRGLYYNLPWLRKIYLLGWKNQFPEWLDETVCSKSNPPIIKINRESLNDGKYLYGSPAVEACMYKIPGLSDLFIYANSDTFVIKKMSKEQWVTKNGIGKLQMSHPIQFNSDTYKFNPSSWESTFIYSQASLFIKKFNLPNFPFFYPTHHITVMSKKAFKDVRKAFPELYKTTLNLKGREEKLYISRTLIDYVSILNGYCKISDTKITGKYLNWLADYSTYKIHSNVSLLCTNLNSYFKKSKYNDYMRFMVKLLPKPIPGEKYMSYEQNCYYTYNNSLVPSICQGKPNTTNDNIALIPNIRTTRKKRQGSKRTTRRH